MALEAKCVLRLQKAQQCLLEDAAANGWTIYNRLSLRNCKYLSANQCQCFLLSHMAIGPPEGTQPISHHPALAHHTVGGEGLAFLNMKNTVEHPTPSTANKYFITRKEGHRKDRRDSKSSWGARASQGFLLRQGELRGPQAPHHTTLAKLPFSQGLCHTPVLHQRETDFSIDPIHFSNPTSRSTIRWQLPLLPRSIPQTNDLCELLVKDLARVLATALVLSKEQVHTASECGY